MSDNGQTTAPTDPGIDAFVTATDTDPVSESMTGVHITPLSSKVHDLKKMEKAHSDARRAYAKRATKIGSLRRQIAQQVNADRIEAERAELARFRKEAADKAQADRARQQAADAKKDRGTPART